MKGDSATIQQFLEKKDPKNDDVLNGLGISARKAEVFWAALSAMSEETGLAIPNFNKLAARIIKTGSSTVINELRKAKLVKRGTKRGEWFLTIKAIKKMDAILGGESIPEEAAAKPRRKPGRPKKAEVSVKIPRRIANKTVGEAVERLQIEDARLVRQIADLQSLREGIAQKIQSIVDLFD